MIKNLQLKFGSSQVKPPLTVKTTPITIFVGPNNAGKSRILFEIEQLCQNGNLSSTNVILNDIEFNPISNPESEITKFTLTPNPGEMLQIGHIIFGKGSHRSHMDRNSMLIYLSNPAYRSQLCQYYIRFNTIRLGGESRINLIQAQAGGDLKMPPQNNLSVLFRDDNKRLEVRRILYDAFKKYFVIDPTNLGQLSIRLSDSTPQDHIQERGIHQEAVDFHQNALDIQFASDGVKAFTGIITTIVAGEPNIILIDEPEAFLHPSLAFSLGKEISNSVKNTEKSLFVSTHSSNFLMGCIQSGVPINIVRLTYSNNVPTARNLPSDRVLHLMRNPLLRSTGILNGLFYEYVVVTESDADRAFYQEINERLLLFNSSSGIPNCLFLNAQNKQTIHDIMKPLREMGIPCAAIVDVDVIKEGGTVWNNLLSSAQMPELTIRSTATSRSSLKVKFDAKSVDFKRNGGVDVLDNGDKEACNNLFDNLNEYGVFTVRNGELEYWLKPLGATGHGPKWLIQIFEKLGEDPANTNYVKPMDDDVWNFIGEIKSWFTNPSRKGIPD